MEKQESKKKVQRNIYVCKRENNRLSTFKQATRLLGWESDRLSLSLARDSTHRTLSHTHIHTHSNSSKWASEQSLALLTHTLKEMQITRAVLPAFKGKVGFDSYCSRGAETKWRMHEDILNQLLCEKFVAYDWQTRARKGRKRMLDGEKFRL